MKNEMVYLPIYLVENIQISNSFEYKNNNEYCFLFEAANIQRLIRYSWSQLPAAQFLP